MTSSNGNIFRVTDHLCGEFTGPGEIQLRGALMFSLISAWTNGLVNNLEAGDLRRNPTHYDIIVMMRCYVSAHMLSITSIYAAYAVFHLSEVHRQIHR